ncbi:serine/threonine protein kinase [Streptomyces sp. NBC_01317]|uniref:serine/threonine-protein kinase n=1 Tax=Streptomyces sp. NBC_01317 TaxID=2903822 RepID=UPI002E15D435|nr:serine/threonine protein kinase [Streptomyces sp. NBC_01317]
MERLVAGDPQQIGSYRLLARLGAGGMGRVYLARSNRGRTVAVKLVRRDLAEQDEFRSRFRHEVEAARRVGGAWTAPVLDADTEAEVPWVATGYVAGPTLQTIVSGEDGTGAGHGPLPETSVRVLASGLARALQDIHAAGLIHRDLKPSNVLVTIEGPRVIDFGIARALESVGEDGLTRTGALMGSPGFMAPEQVRGDRVTAACDIFCLGSVLLYAATGRQPFGAADSGIPALLYRIAQEEPDLSGLPDGLLELIRHCLQKDPAARPTTAEVLVRVAGDSPPPGEPWLPSGLLAQLGQGAVELLNQEDPTTRVQGPGQEVTPLSPPPLPHAAARAQALAPAQAQQPYGYPQTPTPPGFGPPIPPSASFGPTPPYGATPATPYGPPQPSPAPSPYDPVPPPPAPEPAAPRSKRATLALIAVALVVAIGAGGSVYAFMDGGGTDGNKASSSDSPRPKPPADDPTPADRSPSPSPSASPSETAGEVPKEYLGTWTGGVDTATGTGTRELVITQGEVGETVLSLTAEGPTEDGTYHCVFEAALAAAPTPGDPVSIGPSKVTVGEPASSCTPGTPTELTLLGDGRLRRVTTSGEELTYTKSG